MSKPSKIIFQRIPDIICEDIHEYLCEQFGGAPSGYAINLSIEGIEWEDEEEQGAL